MRLSLTLRWANAVHDEEMVPLEFLRRGEWAEVAEVCGEPCWVGRMAELGVSTGRRLRVLQPGSPCMLEVGESRLTIRGDGAMQIFVRPLATAFAT